MRPRLSAPARQPRVTTRGMSIVELMVGITIGLFILAGASLVLTTQLGDNRRLLLEVQVQQDLRAAADLITRELRGAGYWANSASQVWPAAGAALVVNPYRTLTPVQAPAGTTTVQFDRSLDLENGRRAQYLDDGVVNTDEHGGFMLDSNTRTIKMLLSDGNWQELTDKSVVSVTDFSLVITSTPLALPAFLAAPQTAGGCVLQYSARSAVLTIAVEAVRDPLVKRTLRNTIRLRNDVTGC